MLIRTVDLETTGFTPPDHAVIEFGWSDLTSSAVDLIGSPAGWIPGLPSAVFVNPRRPIPPEASAIHHIIDEDVVRGFDWRELAIIKLNPEFREIGDEAVDVIAAHNAKFERLWLTDDLTGGKPWICTYKCALRLWPEAPPHSNQGLRYWRKPPTLRREIASESHRAGPDAYVTAHLLSEMLTETTLEQLIAWSAEPALLVRVHFGQHRGEKWSDVDGGLLRWVLGKDFDDDVKHTARHYLKARESAA